MPIPMVARFHTWLLIRIPDPRIGWSGHRKVLVEQPPGSYRKQLSVNTQVGMQLFNLDQLTTWEAQRQQSSIDA